MKRKKNKKNRLARSKKRAKNKRFEKWRKERAIKKPIELQPSLKTNTDAKDCERAQRGRILQSQKK